MSNESLALSNCDKEPVHIPGLIQPFGALLAFDLGSGKVLHHSSNLCTLIFPDRKISIGQHYEKFLRNRAVIHAIRSAIGLTTVKTHRSRIGGFEIAGKKIDLAVYVVNGVVVIEMEPDKGLPGLPQTPVSMIRSMMSTIGFERSPQDVLNTCVNMLRNLTGHDRVMAYRFLPNGDGEVVAESKGSGIEPFFGLRFPAWDIPNQVRQIMLRSTFRVIQDIEHKHVELVSDSDVSPLDMTLGHLRGVSPIHIEYLRNMGVFSAMNVSIIVRRQLWGLFAFHHYRLRKLAPDQRTIVELFGQFASMDIQQREEQARLEYRQRSRSIISAIGNESRLPEEILEDLGADLIEIMGCHGVAYIKKDAITKFGKTPDEQAMREIGSISDDDPFMVENLTSTNIVSPERLNKTAGVLSLAITADSQLAFYRNEVVHEIRWAGKKEKTITTGPDGPQLTPRRSFAEYKESVANRCAPWTLSDIEVATDIRRELMKSMFESSSELIQQWEEQRKYQDLLVAELNHRVRNTLALVRAIARQTRSPELSLEQYVDSLERRINALSMAHDLVGGRGLQWARIKDLIRGELKPFDLKNGKISYSGPPIAVRADVAPVISLLFHEMTSNAVKHGALSEIGESLSVRWFEDAGGISLEWFEQLNIEVDEPESRGFGFALIERALPFECNGKSTIEFKGKQLLIKFWLPTEAVNELASADAELPQDLPPSTAPEIDLTDLKTALLVEDNLVLAMEMENILHDIGISEVFALSNLQPALEAIECQSFDCAVLDVNLGGENSLELAAELRRRNVPLVLVSGYDNEFELPVELVGVPRLTKPVNRSDIARALGTAKDNLA